MTRFDKFLEQLVAKNRMRLWWNGEDSQYISAFIFMSNEKNRDCREPTESHLNKQINTPEKEKKAVHNVPLASRNWTLF